MAIIDPTNRMNIGFNHGLKSDSGSIGPVHARDAKENKRKNLGHVLNTDPGIWGVTPKYPPSIQELKNTKI